MPVRVVGAFIAMLCGYACYWSARWAIADYAMQNPSRSRIERALRLAPGNPDYYMRLAQVEPALALSALERAAVLNPLNSSVWIELAGAAEAHNDFRAAESSLLRAVQVDKTFAPRWLLAEYYSRRLLRGIDDCNGRTYEWSRDR
jgi:tetratricopeptide (TPR) repeat protein